MLDIYTSFWFENGEEKSDVAFAGHGKNAQSALNVALKIIVSYYTYIHSFAFEKYKLENKQLDFEMNAVFDDKSTSELISYDITVQDKMKIAKELKFKVNIIKSHFIEDIELEEKKNKQKEENIKRKLENSYNAKNNKKRISPIKEKKNKRH